MSLDKAVKHGKEHRKQHGWRLFLHQCGCCWCQENLRHSTQKENCRTDSELEIFEEDYGVKLRYKKMYRRCLPDD